MEGEMFEWIYDNNIVLENCEEHVREHGENKALRWWGTGHNNINNNNKRNKKMKKQNHCLWRRVMLDD